MLLRRLSQNLREQNWAAVALDFLIVVVGILVGMQANGWSESRKAEREAAYYVSRLSDELTATVNRFDQEIEGGRVLADRSLAAYRMLRANELTDATKEEFEANFIAIHSVPDVVFTVAALDEMKSTGKIGVLADRDVRERLYEFLEILEFSRTQQTVIMQSFSDAFSKSYEIVDYAPDYMQTGVLLTAAEDRPTTKRSHAISFECTRCS